MGWRVGADTDIRLRIVVPGASVGKAANLASFGMTFGSHRFPGSHFERPLNGRQALPWNPMNERRKLGGGEGHPNGALWVEADRAVVYLI